jgi:hypothetical protein
MSKADASLYCEEESLNFSDAIAKALVDFSDYITNYLVSSLLNITTLEH